MAQLPNSVGFIGLGVMGYPMVQNLADKLPKDAKLFVYDVSEDAMKRILEEKGPERIKVCQNAKHVAENSVSVSDLATARRTTNSSEQRMLY